MRTINNEKAFPILHLCRCLLYAVVQNRIDNKDFYTLYQFVLYTRLVLIMNLDKRNYL